MATKSLAIKYRPQTFDDVVEQGAVKTILTQQLASGEVKHAYLFCGGAGTGKTTCARIFANEINHLEGNPIEMDAASNSSVDDVREIIQQAKTKSLDSEYKVFIIDECHSLSNTAWQALLKLLEEPPAKSIFIFCTTDPQKIPRTILSRVQRYDFQRISHQSVKNRLIKILEWEKLTDYTEEAIDYLAKLADGGMRDAITLMDKCLAFSPCLDMNAVVSALGTADYSTMFDLLSFIQHGDGANIITTIENIHMAGKDLKQFIKQFTDFVLDCIKYQLSGDFAYVSIPTTYRKELDIAAAWELSAIMQTLVTLNSEIKWDTTPKASIEASLLLEARA